jgi:hypothetical protein
MRREITLGTRRVNVTLTDRAEDALANQTTPLDIELELYFSCLIRKRVNVLTAPHPDVAARTNLTPAITVSFRPVMTEHCSIRDVESAPGVRGVTLANGAAFTPRWLTLDYHHGQFCGEFGYAHA